MTITSVPVNRYIFDLSKTFPFPKREQIAPTCGAHALISLIEHYEHNVKKRSIEPISVLHAYHYYRELHGVDRGSHPAQLFDMLKLIGIVNEQDWPETRENHDTVPPPATLMQTTKHLIDDYELVWLSRYNEPANANGRGFLHFVLNQLKKRNPVAITFLPCDYDLPNLTPDTEYEMNLEVAPHAALIVGFSSDKRFLLRDTAQNTPDTYTVPFDYIADKRFTMEAFYLQPTTPTNEQP